MPHDIFISYPQGDKESAERVCSLLEQNGFACWIAPRDILPSSTWATSIVRAIKECRVMALILSQRANQSDQIPREVSLALQERVHVVPLRMENVQPAGDLEYYLPSTQWLDLFPKPLESYSQELVRVIRTLLGQPAPPHVEPIQPKIIQKALPADLTLTTQDKVIIVLCYFIPYLIPGILLLLFSKRKVMRFHAWQTIFISIVVDSFAIAAQQGDDPSLTTVVGVFAIISWIAGIIFLVRGKIVLPVIGPMAQKLSGGP